MREHLDGAHGLGVGWDCEKCGKHFKRKVSFVHHTRNGKCVEKDLVDKHASCKGSKYQCLLCVYSSLLRGNMKKHLEGTHGLGMGHDCEKCGKNFKHRGSLVRHSRNTKCAK